MDPDPLVGISPGHAGHSINVGNDGNNNEGDEADDDLELTMKQLQSEFG